MGLVSGACSRKAYEMCYWCGCDRSIFLAASCASDAPSDCLLSLMGLGAAAPCTLPTIHDSWRVNARTMTNWDGP
eukprot:scaffold50415_cov28-Tisochrysis_lutea.AAC.1